MDTPGCTTQACGVRDRGADYDAAGARVIDADGRIARVFPKVSPKTHDDEVLAALGELAAA